MAERLLSAEFCNSLKSQVSMLNELYQEKLAAVKNAPKGRLRIMQQGPNKLPRYYLVKGKYSNGTYLDGKHFTDACRLAQKAYDEKLLAEIAKVRGSLNALLAKMEKTDLDGVYENLLEGRRDVVNPFRLGLSDFAERWQNVEYERKPFEEDGAKIQTSMGFFVRSKSEMMIADTLSYMKIPFRYEQPLKIRGMGTVHPDFTCLNKRTGKEYIWEHLGMMGQEEYACKAIERLRHYQNAGYYFGDNLICSMETKSLPLNSSMVKKIAEHYLV
ncbi:MAG: hypothetical protein MJZ26_03625 [Fibrobacter sp.]|nr:hypothetical protein [Fibrobacter sp.]